MEILVHKQRRSKLVLPNTIAEANSYHIKRRGNNDTEKTSQGRENKPRRGTTSFRSPSQMLTMKAIGKINRCFFEAIEAVHGFCIFHSLRCRLPPTVRELRKSAEDTHTHGRRLCPHPENTIGTFLRWEHNGLCDVVFPSAPR